MNYFEAETSMQSMQLRFIIHEAMAVFAEKLADFEVSKGTIRLPHDRDLPEALIADIAKWCYAAYNK